MYKTGNPDVRPDKRLIKCIYAGWQKRKIKLLDFVPDLIINKPLFSKQHQLRCSVFGPASMMSRKTCASGISSYIACFEAPWPNFRNNGLRFRLRVLRLGFRWAGESMVHDCFRLTGFRIPQTQTQNACLDWSFLAQARAT